MWRKNSGHFARRIAFAKDLVAAERFLAEHVTTKNNAVDFFGKLVTADKYRASCNCLMYRSVLVPPSREGGHCTRQGSLRRGHQQR